MFSEAPNVMASADTPKGVVAGDVVANRIATNRFGYGASQQDIVALARTTPEKWLQQQLSSPYSMTSVSWNSAKAIVAVTKYNAERKNAPDNKKQITKQRRAIVKASRSLAEQTVQQSFTTEKPLQARLLDFFSNHFSVSTNNFSMIALAPTLEIEAIAPHLNGSFKDMLKSVISHPAMLVYLNNERSVGPNSKFGKRRKKKGLNENLGRELLELHTLGVDSAYTQQDVLEVSKALTGWSVGNPSKNEAATFIFRDIAHEPGARLILGKSYAATKKHAGPAQAMAVLDDLALHPSTARHLSYKLAKHFVADEPPVALVNAMTTAYLSSKADIPSVVTAMIEHPTSWQRQQQKLKTPRDFLVSACRACSVSTPRPGIYQLQEVMGQALFNAGSPAGFSDETNAWSGPQAIMSRIEWSMHFAKQVKKEALTLADIALGPLLEANTLEQMQRAESQYQATVLLLMSPEFQRR